MIASPPPAPSPVLCRRLTYCYPGGHRANASIDLQIAAGEVFGLIGPNGSGKTTLISQLIGERRPTLGEVLVFGRDPRESTLRARIGLVPQSANLYPTLTVESHLQLFGPLRGLSRRRTRAEVDRRIEECQLSELRKQRVGTLSGGQYRRVLLALALLGGPDLLLLDEPTVGLDPGARRAFWTLLQRLRADGATIVLATHHLDEIEKVCTRIGLLHEGRLARCGSMRDLRAAVALEWTVQDLDRDPADPGRAAHFESYDAAQDHVRCLGLENYAVGPIGLEAVYHRLVETA